LINCGLTLNFNVFFEGIFNDSFVLGLRPTRAALLYTVQLPSPLRLIRSPFLRDSIMLSDNASSALLADFLEIPAFKPCYQ
jgi:hypothetical protein